MTNFIRAIGLACCFGSLASAQDPANALSKTEKKEGWQLLFDGKTLAGWDVRPTSVPGVSGDWTVENGALVCPGKTPGWLATSAEFANFHLKLEFRGSEKVNSGVFLRSKKEGQPHLTGYELQIWDYQPAGYNTGSLVEAIKAPPVKILAERWNKYDITADGNHYLIVLNGATVLDTHQTAHQSGTIGLQCQVDNRIEFRDLRILPVRR